ncbi:glutaredoxin domain-containing protein [Gordonia zhaorongruii]|uniref:glutaredoxin domain-containing protein n=1 Tax=Gordonia zhaorongruii TaxID=2597659 RepID=UPI001F333582|nr:glutaredoxin domain-containing protein [Gordonia zhaorongruii]
MRSVAVWFVWLVLVGAGLWLLADGSWSLIVVFAVLLAAFGWWLFPRRGSGPDQRDAVVAAEAGTVVIYWRPGCMYCARLRRRLVRVRNRAVWVNIWADADAAVFVRSVNDGDETVPTVVIDGVAHTNPPADTVRGRLSEVG